MSPVSNRLGVTTSKSNSSVSVTRERSISPYPSNTSKNTSDRKDRISNPTNHNSSSRSAPRLSISLARQHILPHINVGKGGSSKVSRGSAVVEKEPQKSNPDRDTETSNSTSSKFHQTEHGSGTNEHEPVLPPSQSQSHRRPQTQNHSSQDIACVSILC